MEAEEIIDKKLENIVTVQSAQILKLEQELELYKHLFGELNEEMLQNAPQKQTVDQIPSMDDKTQNKSETDTPMEVSKSSKITTDVEKTITTEPVKEETRTEGNLSETAINLTLKFSQECILKSYKYEKPKKSSVLFAAPKLLTVHNYTKSVIYGTVYDRVRMGVSGKHVRVSPVFVIEEKPLIFEKPYLRGSRSLHFLFCKDVTFFEKNSVELSDLKFRSFPQICIDFSTDIVVDIDEHNSLIGLPKAQWEKQTIRTNLEQSQQQIQQQKRISTDIQLPPENILNEETINMAKQAHVRFEKSLCEEEIEFLNKRSKITKEGLEEYLDFSLDDKYVPRIAFCGSGGGCRAMVSTLGFIIGMQNIGLIDCLTYIAGVSGSTWTLGLWTSLGISPSDLRGNIATKFAQNLITRPNSKGASELVTILRQKWTPGNRNLSLVDIYGAQLAAGLLHDTKPAGCEYKLSHQSEQLIDADIPMPIYTAVQRQVDGYHSWFEFTPYEVGSSDYNAFVPTYGFGRAYRKGVSIDMNSEPSLGLLLGTFGSAFCAPLQRVAEELFDTPDHEEQGNTVAEVGYLKKSVLEYKDTVERVIDKMSLQHTSFLAASRFNNFAYNPSVEASRMREPILELYDAGIDCNLPFPVLLRPEREVDIIIACDSSKYPDINRGRALREAQEWAERNNIKLPPIDYANSYATHVTVYRDLDDPLCPVVIFLPLKCNFMYSTFDPQEVQRAGGYCSTFNFNMTTEQVQELSGLSEYNMTIADPVIKETIKQVIEQKTEYFKNNPKVNE